MPTPAQNRATTRYRAKAYDQINVKAPKGGREEIQAAAAAAGQSVNAYILQAVRDRMSAEAAPKEPKETE